MKTTLELLEETVCVLQCQQKQQIELIKNIQEEQSLEDEIIRDLVGKLLHIVDSIDLKIKLIGYEIKKLKKEEE